MQQNPTPAQSRAKCIMHRYVFALIILGVFSVGVLLGHSGDAPVLSAVLRKSNLASNTICSPIANKNSKYSLPGSIDFKNFWDVWDKIQNKSVQRPVDEEKMYRGAMQGLVAALNDPYSVYFTPEIAKQFQEELQGSFSGIGAEIGSKNNNITVITPLADSPAERAGLSSGDIIISINDETAAGLSVDEAVKRIRGPEGTTVKLVVVREHTGSEPITITIKRQRIELKSVTNKILPNNTLLIQVTGFNEQTARQFEDALAVVKNKKIERIILDLRNNPGGFLDTSIAFASEWLDDNSLVVSERGNDDSTKQDYRAFGLHRLKGIPTVVLVNEGTASAAEIVAGALQDVKAATLLGTKTFGKGSVQEYEELPDGGGLKLTVALWYTPLGRSINHDGVVPDIVMEELKNKNPEESIFAKKDWTSDPLIQRALSLLIKK